MYKFRMNHQKAKREMESSTYTSAQCFHSNTQIDGTLQFDCQFNGRKKSSPIYFKMNDKQSKTKQAYTHGPISNTKTNTNIDGTHPILMSKNTKTTVFIETSGKNFVLTDMSKVISHTHTHKCRSIFVNSEFSSATLVLSK